MRTYRILFVAAATMLAGLGGGTSPGRAQGVGSPEALQVARELASMTSDSMLSDIAGNFTKLIWPTMEAALRLKNPTIDADTLSELQRECERLQARTLQDSMGDAAVIYARHFAADELRAIVAFYRSPVGAKALRAMPQASAELIGAMQPRLQLLQATANQRIATILQQHGYAP